MASESDTAEYADGYSGPTSIDPTGEVELVASADYELHEKLGQGGMGEVWKAWDHRLGRVVALKLLRAEASGPAVAAELLREARALARVEHPNVCRVYGVGEREGRAFLALQYVEGGATLTQVAPEMSREQLVRVIALVAEALHAAHRAGIVHRDIKPDNILIERGDGTYRPYVADFGVARILDGPERTRTGEIKGTPQYMSPEQVRGEPWRIDRRSDVYALGVVLYEALARQRPFTGEGVAVMHQITTTEPVPPRRLDSSIPRDLELIALRCLEKDPARRYDSARSLAADLWAWIDGKPIHARPASAIYRVRKWTRRNLALSVAIGISASAALVVGGVVWNARRIAREQVVAAQALGAEIAERDALARFSAMTPLHDLRPERQRTEAYIAELRGRLAHATPAAAGPVRYALGRAHLTIDQPEAALVEFNGAATAGFEPGELSYARGLAYWQLYDRRLQRSEGIDAREAREAKRRALEHELGAPALADLKRARGVRIDAPEIVEGLIALAEERDEDALAFAKRALANAPWRFEAQTLIGDAYYHRARRHAEADRAAALVDLEHAERAYDEAFVIGRSAVDVLRGRCRARSERVRLMVDAERSPEPLLTASRNACSDLRTALAGDGEALACEATAIGAAAYYRETHGQDADELWRAVLVLLDQHEPTMTDPAAWLATAQVNTTFAEFEVTKGRDPGPRIAHALAALENVRAVDDFRYLAFIEQSAAHRIQADWQSEHGTDPVAAFRQAIASAEHALPYARDRHGGHYELAKAHRGLADWYVSRGQDPRPEIDIVLNELALTRPKMHEAQHLRCATLLTLLDYENNIDAATPSFARAREQCLAAAEMEPASGMSWYTLAMVERQQADWLTNQKGDPERVLRDAQDHIGRALTINPSHPAFLETKGRIAKSFGKWEAREGRSPLASMTEAVRAMEAAIAAGRSARNLAILSSIHLTIAEWKLEHGLSPATDIRAGLKRANEAIALDPQFGWAKLHAAAFLALEAQTAARADRAAQLAKARQLLKQAVTLDESLRPSSESILSKIAQLEK